MTTVSIKGDGGEIRITVHGYERPDAVEFYDANWLTCTVRVVAGPMTGEVPIALQTQDFVVFRDEVSAMCRSLKGRANFTTMERGLAFRISMGQRGNATVVGRLTRLEAQGARLVFRFETDQSLLEAVVSQTEDVIRKFPVR